MVHVFFGGLPSSSSGRCIAERLQRSYFIQKKNLQANKKLIFSLDYTHRNQRENNFANNKPK